MSILVKERSLGSSKTITNLFVKGSIYLPFIILLQSCTFSTISRKFDENRPIPEFDSNLEFSHELDKLQENSLKTLPNPYCLAVYRFLWLRTFHNWISIRVEHHKDGNTKVFAKEFERREAAVPQSLLKNLSIKWPPAKYQIFARKIKAMGFWDSPSVETIKLGEVSIDGAAWILEGVEQSRYHVIARGTVTIKRSALKQLGLYLLKETDLLPPKEQSY